LWCGEWTKMHLSVRRDQEYSNKNIYRKITLIKIHCYKKNIIILKCKICMGPTQRFDFFRVYAEIHGLFSDSLDCSTP